MPPDLQARYDDAYRKIMSGGDLNSGVPLAVTSEEAAQQFQLWQRKYPKLPPTLVPTPDTNEAQKRVLYRYEPKRLNPGYFETEAQHKIFSLYIAAHHENVNQFLLEEVLERLPNGYATVLKDISEIMKKYQHRLSEHWVYYAELGDLQDYAPPIDETEIVSLVRDWVEGSVTHEFADSSPTKVDFLTALAEGIRVFLTPTTEYTGRLISTDEFLADPYYWATPGASYEGRLELFTLDGKRVKARKSKWGSACSLGIRRLKLIYYSTKPQYNVGVVKREKKKSRMIIVGDLGNYLRMHRISMWLEAVLKGHPNTTLFHTKKQMLELWTTMIANCMPPPDRKIDQPNFPADESEYDHNVDKPMINVWFNELEFAIFRYSPNEITIDLYTASELTRESLLSPDAVVAVNHVRIIIKKGLMSGWRWTAIMDTAFNAGKTYAYRKRIMLRLNMIATMADPILQSTHQGDDLRSKMRSFVHAQLFNDMYQETGFTVNPTKVFCETRADEFLRKIALPNRIAGYPARALVALLYRNPVSRPYVPGEERMSETAKNWLTVIQRNQSPPNFAQHMYRDIARGNNISQQDAYAFCHSPATYGGMGLLPESPTQVELIKAQKTEEYKPFIAPLAEGFSDPLIATKIWMEGVDTGPKIKKTWTSFSLRITPREQQTPFQHRFIPSTFSAKLEPPNFDIKNSPTEIAILKYKAKEMTAQELRDNVRPALTELSKSKFDTLFRKASIRVLKAWIEDDLPFRVPANWRQSDTYVSPVYNTMAAYGWTEVMRSRKITYSLLTKAAYNTEVWVRNAAAAMQYTYAA